jgi:hypothetical protein
MARSVSVAVSKKLGHPVPDSNFVSEPNNSMPEEEQTLLVVVPILACEGAFGALLRRERPSASVFLTFSS